MSNLTNNFEDEDEEEYQLRLRKLSHWLMEYKIEKQKYIHDNVLIKNNVILLDGHYYTEKELQDSCDFFLGVIRSRYGNTEISLQDKIGLWLHRKRYLIALNQLKKAK
jgi:hypothetical protein